MYATKFKPQKKLYQQDNALATCRQALNPYLTQAPNEIVAA